MKILFPIFTVLHVAACNSVDDNRLPLLPVSINLGDTGTWSAYGVSGFGTSRNFILNNGERVPSSFPFNRGSATGYGGILLISGMDPFSATTDIPLAYDLSCPVEAKPDIRVEIEGDLYEAVCPVCDSHYDVTMGGGTPLSGPAAATYKCGMKRYSVLPTTFGGYVITN